MLHEPSFEPDACDEELPEPSFEPDERDEELNNPGLKLSELDEDLDELATLHLATLAIAFAWPCLRLFTMEFVGPHLFFCCNK